MKPTLQDVIYLDPPPTAKPKDSAPGALLIFFITGNPGLIAFYGPFLDRLQSLLCDEEGLVGGSRCYTYGASLAGHMARDEMHEITDDKFSDDIWGTSGNADDEGKVLQSKASAVVIKQADASRDLHMRRPTTKLYFYWGKNDHWVADNTRDTILAARAQKATDEPMLEKSKPVMEIDRNGIPHGFCLQRVHSNLVAEKVANWIKEIRTNHVSYQRDAL
ncbi:hypothetical protein D0864_05052 [Hortaea werneckii]|uniref:Uncharacterized protein n=1 Tax=Hortaea werneckii TaxID=91943 RepID=A0A3M7G7F6_HORWE|nr:hypothetical protein D0864_05052 [Hortaea werneckii]